MSILRTGSTTKYADGWEAAFGRSKKKPAKQKPTAKAATDRKKKAAGSTKKKGKKRK